MAKKKTTKKNGKTTALAVVDDAALAAMANEEVSREANVGGGSQFFSIRGGVMKFDGQALPDNEFVGVILDAVMENVYYEGKYDPDNMSSPACYAFGRDEDTIGPHEAADRPQSEQCMDCDNNQWGSADTGRGKACRNRRRLAILPGGALGKDGEFEAFDDVEHFEKAQAGYMAVPPTSLKNWAGYVKQLKASHQRPSFSVFTKVSLVPDSKNQMSLEFEYVEDIPSELLGIVIGRHKTMKELIEFPYQKVSTAAAAAKSGPKRGRSQARR